MSSIDRLRPFKGACAIAMLGLILTIVSIATPQWTVTPNETIGLWSLNKGENTYTWTDTGAYEDFFYSSWFMAARALVMAGVIIGGLGILFNFYVIRKNPQNGGVVLLVYYMLAFCLLVSGAAVYCCLIPQGVTSEGKITTNKDDIKMYLYLGNYGYSMWLCWIASGIFLLASGMAFEGSNQQNRAKRNKRLIDA